MDETNDAMTDAMDGAIGKWLPKGAEILWQSQKLFDGSFLQRHVLAVDPDDGSVTILRGWMSGQEAKPSVSVDLSVPYEDFAGEIDGETFPHSPDAGRLSLSSRASPLENAFRAQLLGEHVEVLWQSLPDESHGAFIARSAKVNRSEHVIAGTVTMEGGAPTVEIGFRQELASFKPVVRHAMSR